MTQNTVFYEREKQLFFLFSIISLSLFIFFIIQICRIDKINLTFPSESLNYNTNDYTYTIDHISIPNGIYEININYSSSSDVNVNISTDWGYDRFLLSDNPILPNNRTFSSFCIWISDNCDVIHISTKSESSDYKIDSINISTSPLSKKYLITKCSFWFLLLFLILLLIYKQNKLLPLFFPYGLILIIAFIASLGMFNSYLSNGHDLNYHLLRIEGLKESIVNGVFPDKIQSNWCCGWGYAVSAMYGDLILLPSSLLRILGFPLITCYKLYVVLINLGTAFISYYVFFQISHNKTNSVLTSFLYTCAPYRLCCIYIRSAMGEYSAFLFFPLIILAIFYIFKDTNDSKYGNSILLPSMGFALLLQTHILSCIMSSIFIILFFAINYKKLFDKKRIIYILKIAISSISLSLWFLVPFIRFSKEPLIVYSDSSWNSEIQWYGASLTELFAQIPSPSTNFNFAYSTGLSERMPLPIGNGFIIIIITYLCFNRIQKHHNDNIIKICLTLSIVSAFLSSIYFPYNKFHDLLPKIFSFISTIQFPYRFISITIVLLSVSSIFMLNKLNILVNKHLFYLLLSIIFIISFHQSVSLLYNSIYRGSPIVYYDSINLRTNELMGYQYLYEGTDYSIPEKENNVEAYNVSIVNNTNKANTYQITCKSIGDNSYIELPLYYYPGYIAKDSMNQNLIIERGNNNRIRVNVPQNYNGKIYIKYSEPIMWRIMELVSLFSFIVLCFLQFRKTKNKVKIGEPEIEQV